MNKVEEYKSVKCNSQGWVKKRNISRSEADGLKEIKEKVKNKEMVVFSTDKSSKLTADTVSNYNKALEKHVENDIKIDQKKVRKIENDMNNHMRQFNRMFRVGATWGHEDRIAGATTSTNVPPPGKYGLRKDHKTVQPGQEKFGPDVRPVCGADEAPNSRFSHFISKMINHYADSVEKHNECKSSEEMRASFEEFNKLDKKVREKCKIISMDVKALYPSMRWVDIVRAVKDMITKSDMEIENVDWVEVSRYIAVMVPSDEIEREGLGLVIPKRKRRRTRNITFNYLRSRAND